MIDLDKHVKSRYKWLDVNNKSILYVNLKESTEEEIIACSYMIHPNIQESSLQEDIRLLIDFSGIDLTPKIMYHSALMARSFPEKTGKRAWIGLNGYTMALARMSNLQQNKRIRLFESYPEAINYLAYAD